MADEVRVKALYGLSCPIRENVVFSKSLESLDGYGVQVRAIQSKSKGKKLRIKAEFLITSQMQQLAPIKIVL